MKKINKKAFTLVELIVWITIISILSTIWFISITWYLVDTRNSERISDLSQIKVAIKTYKNQKSKIPFPEDYFGIKNWAINNIAWQWKLWKNISLSTIDEIPFDPKLKIPYSYSITASKQEFQLGAVLESEDNWDEAAIIVWNYNSVSQNLLPSLLVATWTSIDITDSENKKLFIFNGQKDNLPYSFESWDEPISNGTDFNILLQNAKDSNNFFQNSDFETCEEVDEWLKNIWDWDYELRDEYWILTSSGCTF